MKYSKRRRRAFAIVAITAVIITTGAVSYLITKSKNDTSNIYSVKANSGLKQADKQDEAKKDIKQDETKKDIKQDEKVNGKTNEGTSDKTKQNNVVVTSTKTDNTKSADAEASSSKIAYLTFDDGPSKKVTPVVLDTLKRENIKATFFVVGQAAKDNPELLKRVKEEGHVIGNHTYSHNYKYIYSNINNFLDDLKKNDNMISSIIGDYNKGLIRFPSGSFGKQAYIKAAHDAGYHQVDWNSLNGDAEGKKRSAEELIERFKETSRGKKNLTILMHDAIGKETTAEALPKIIQYLKSQGYEFKTLN